MSAIPPNQTIYLRNLNEKIRKEELKETLYNLCIPFGRIMDIVALKTMKMRGQAFVVFWDISSATNALRHLNGVEVYEKPIVVEYALSKSVAVMRLENDGELVQKPENISAARRKKLLGISDTNDKSSPLKRSKNQVSDDEDNDNEQNSKRNKRQAVENSESKADNTESNNASPILFIENLPRTGNCEEKLKELFEKYDGFRGVRMISGKPEIAFVDYETASQAAEAKKILSGFKITPSNSLSIKFAS
ncbi:hypothetical protein H4219_003721 [Mycoemilia scoparia]|uniref:RRM domain-containing protein n=1 Tax=Mycoemilia scoparia TaxID=417184 RepID=A0A9W7ZTY9_9FUNG|nr:hypothetical protein H4219_003721 [Mycoemilia scoparia]